MANPRNTLSKLTVWDKYANYLPEVKRRENWDEIVMRLEEMYLKLYPNEKSNIIEAMDAVRSHKILPSMRSAQFSGDPILTHPSRNFNCSFLHISSVEAFAEVMYCLLSGSGVGYSVQGRHINQLPVVKGSDTSKTRRYRVHDQIEGWSDAVLMELKSHFEGTREIRFDMSDIRGPDKLIKSSGRKAPGSAKLSEILLKIRAILKGAVGRKLTSLEVHDICCWIAWCVVAGGVRRSAMIALYDHKDLAMRNCKAGEWWNEHPQRGRANNSEVLIRGEVTEADFRALMKQTEENRTGEPAPFWTNDPDLGTNPCQPYDAPVLKLTSDGPKLTRFGTLEVGDSIWSAEGWTKVVKKWSTGIKPTFAYNTTRGTFYGTDKHRVLQDGVKIEVGQAEAIDMLTGPTTLETVEHNAEWIMAGLLMGDGMVHKTSKDPILLVVGENDGSYFESEVADLFLKSQEYSGRAPAWNVKQSIVNEEDLTRTFNRTLKRFMGESQENLCSLLRGLYSANGSVVSNRITLKAASFDMIRDVQTILSSIGISSYYTTNKEKDIKWDNGTYTSKESYDLNITTDRARFAKLIGFIHPYKNDKLTFNVAQVKPRNTTSNIVSIDELGEQEVFDITVDNASHTYWTAGLNVSNCAEISLRNMQFCNLTSINFASVVDQADFLNRVRLATYLGTLQAAFTDFLYLRDEWVDNCEEEALLGVSITGICENLPLFFSLDFDAAAETAKETNAEASRRIGIREAARILTIKPEGTGTLVARAVTAGAHDGPGPYWIKHFTLDKNTDLYKFLVAKAPSYVVDSPYVKHEAYFAIPLSLPDHVKNSELNTPALDVLKRIEFIYNNWIVKGHRTGANTHNVSSTVRVRNSEWKDVTDWMWENKHRYAAISFLHISDVGEESATSFTLLPQQVISKEQHDIMVNGGEYEGHHYAGWKDLDFDELLEETNNVDLTNELACAGGACII